MFTSFPNYHGSGNLFGCREIKTLKWYDSDLWWINFRTTSKSDIQLGMGKIHGIYGSEDEILSESKSKAERTIESFKKNSMLGLNSKVKSR